VTGAESKDGSKANVRERPLASNDNVERTERTEIEWADASELRTITPEEVQILAATGC
jgi:hypothetical protein